MQWWHLLRVSGRRVGLGVFVVSVAWGTSTVSPSKTGTQVRRDRKQNAVIDYSRRVFLSKADRSVLAEARANGLKKIVVVVASQAGQNLKLTRALTALGCVVRYRNDAVDYLSVIVPIDRVEEISQWSMIAAINVDATVQRSALSADAEFQFARSSGFQAQSRHTAGDSSVAQPGPATPRLNPYLPTRDVGAPQFIAKHSTFDGRGITIGIIDGGLDVWTPELQQATTLNGHPTRKIVDWIVATDPLGETLPLTAPIVGFKGDCEWVDMRIEVGTPDNVVVFNGDRYIVPNPGKYRIGNLNERQTCFSYWLGFDVNRDGNPAGSSGLFAVLWNEQTGDVWVDANQNRSFADEQRMHDYAERFDVGHFGTDNPCTPVRESVPFVVHVDPSRKFVHVSFTSAAHGEMVAGTATGRGFFGGAFDGVAPGAAIVLISIGANYYFHTVIEAAIMAAEHSKVDLVEMAVGAQPATNTGTLVQDIIINRLIDRFGKPFFVSAGNERSSLETVTSPSVASNAFSIGAWIGKESLVANYAVRIANDEYVFSYSGHGPRDDGDLKPDFVAPSGGVAPKPRVYPGDKAVSGYQLPPGYRVGGGTSQASPFAAGVAALLMSAARQTQTPCDVNRLRIALTSSARFSAHYGANVQGSGLVQVEAAWDALQKMRDVSPVTIQSRGSVKTVLSHLLTTPNSGVGLYEREGWVPQQRAQRTITLIRTSGPDRSILYGLRWIGDKETFSSDTVVALPLRIPVVIRVSVSPPGMGVHSAILNVADRETGLTLHRVLATIVAAPPLDARNGFVIRSTGQVSRPGSRSEFVRVPAHTSVLELAALARDGFLKVQICDPTGRYVPEGELEWLDFQYLQAGRELRRAIENPMPGVWEIVILNDRDLFRLDQNAPFPLSSNAYELTIRAISARLDSRSDSPIAINEMAPIETRIVSSPLAVLQNKKPAVTRNASQRLFEVVIPRQSGTLVVNLANVSDLSADLDLYLFDCTSGYCVLRGSRVDPCPIQSLTVHRPAAGTWKVVLDGFSLPSGNAHADLNEIATTKPANYFRMGKAGVKARLVEVLGDSVTSFETRRKVGRPPALPGEAEDVELVTWNVPLARALVVPSIR